MLARDLSFAHRFWVLVYFGAWALAIQPRIYGGDIAKPCEFPTTVYSSGCTGTLVHPQVVLSAGHCPETEHFDFGESIASPALRVPVKWCESTPFSSTDARICVLEHPVEGLAVAPIIQGCEVQSLKVDAPVLLAGFGLDETDPASGAQLDEKRWVATTINQIAQNELSVGGNNKGGCQGDSGGPVYLKLPDGTYRTVGVTHGGEAHPNCDKGVYKRSDQLLEWYESKLRAHDERDIDLSPCFDAQGGWAPTRACGGYAKDVQGPYADWSTHCGQGMPIERYSASCGAPFDPSTTAGTSTGGSQSPNSPAIPPVAPTPDATNQSPTRSPAPSPISSKQSNNGGCRLLGETGGVPDPLGLLIFALTFSFRRRR